MNDGMNKIAVLGKLDGVTRDATEIAKATEDAVALLNR
jgi:hypothetical protein